MYQGENQGQGHQGFQHFEVDALSKLNSALSLAKAMPPSKLKKNLIGLVNLAPEIEQNLLQKIQLPMQIDSQNPGFPFLKTQFNRDGNSYRNPFTNHYSPNNAEGYRPSGFYRALEETGAVLFAEYVKQYYGTDTVGSFFVTESDVGDGSFSCGFFAKKLPKDQDGFEGSWDSFNIVDVFHDGTSFNYHLHTTILIQMQIEQHGINLTGFLKKTKQEKKNLSKTSNEDQQLSAHIQIIGEMIEDLETTMRQHLQAIYVSKTKEVIFTTRYQNTIAVEQHRQSLADGLRKLRFGN